MTALYILSQIMAALGIMFALISAVMKTKKKMLVFMLCASLCNITSYALIMSIMSVVVCLFVLTRTIWYFVLTQKEKPFKHYLLPMFFVLIGFYCMFPFIYQIPLDLILLISTTITTIALAFRNLFVIRIVLAISCALWFVYDLYLASYVMVASDIAHVVVYMIAIIIFNIIPFVQAKKETSNNQEEDEKTELKQDGKKQSVRVRNTITKQ